MTNPLRVRLEDMIEDMADNAKIAGENNLAIVLYSYLGASKSGNGGQFANHCQDFSIEHLKKIQARENKRN
jgi:hypothetical protein